MVVAATRRSSFDGAVTIVCVLRLDQTAYLHLDSHYPASNRWVVPIIWVANGRSPVSPSFNVFHRECRSALKARSKNPVLRAHKAFFGRQRLGLAPASDHCAYAQVDSHQPGTTDAKYNGLAQISLKHARRRRGSVQSPEDVGFIPGPTPLKPPISRLLLDSGCKPRRHSDVLNALDETVLPALFIRDKLDKMLRIPDLAGLHRSAATRTYGSSSDPGLKRKRSAEHVKKMYGHKRQHILSPPATDSPRPSVFVDPNFSALERQGHAKADTFISSPSDRNHPTFPNTPPQEVTTSGSSLPDSSIPSIHDSDFTTLSSPSTLGLRHPGSPRFPPQQSFDLPGISPQPDLEDVRPTQGHVDCSNLVGYSSPYTSIEEACDSHDASRSGPFDDDVSAENLLYQEDPWKALDVILDLRPGLFQRSDAGSASYCTPGPVEEGYDLCSTIGTNGVFVDNFENQVFRPTSSEIHSSRHDIPLRDFGCSSSSFSTDGSYSSHSPPALRITGLVDRVLNNELSNSPDDGWKDKPDSLCGGDKSFHRSPSRPPAPRSGSCPLSSHDIDALPGLCSPQDFQLELDYSLLDVRPVIDVNPNPTATIASPSQSGPVNDVPSPSFMYEADETTDYIDPVPPKMASCPSSNPTEDDTLFGCSPVVDSMLRHSPISESIPPGSPTVFVEDGPVEAITSSLHCRSNDSERPVFGKFSQPAQSLSVGSEATLSPNVEQSASMHAVSRAPIDVYRITCLQKQGDLYLGPCLFDNDSEED